MLFSGPLGAPAKQGISTSRSTSTGSSSGRSKSPSFLETPLRHNFSDLPVPRAFFVEDDVRGRDIVPCRESGICAPPGLSAMRGNGLEDAVDSIVNDSAATRWSQKPPQAPPGLSFDVPPGERAQAPPPPSAVRAPTSLLSTCPATSRSTQPAGASTAPADERRMHHVGVPGAPPRGPMLPPPQQRVAASWPLASQPPPPPVYSADVLPLLPPAAPVQHAPVIWPSHELPPPPGVPATLVVSESGGATTCMELCCGEVPEPALGSPTLPSVGSAGHWLGTCKPCAFLHTKGCANGVQCVFCHLCGAGEKKRRMKEKKLEGKLLREQFVHAFP